MTNIVQLFKSLKGNTRTCILFEPMWGIPFVVYTFYLSLYMKELGITDRQLGYLISIGYISGSVFSAFAGIITDRLGRKKTTFIFDIISWPAAIAIYLISNSFILFAAATIINNLTRIVNVSFNMLLVEDADDRQRLSAYTLINIINISTGVLLPIGGILVNAYGVVRSERIFFIIAILSMTTMMLVRNLFLKETCVGQQILEDHKVLPARINLKSLLSVNALAESFKKPQAIMVICLFVLFNLQIPLSTVNSLYFAPYMTEVLHLGKPEVSILGGVYSAVLFIVFVFVIPAAVRLNKYIVMVAGLAVQVLALFALIVIPPGSLPVSILCILSYAMGFGIFKPFLDPLLAEITEGRDRAGAYSGIYTISCISTALIGFVSGILYDLNPRIIYMISMCLLAVCTGIMFMLSRSRAICK